MTEERTIEILKKIEAVKEDQIRFVQIKNGSVHFITTDVEIPRPLVVFQKIPKDGFYQIFESSCMGNCIVGSSEDDCVMHKTGSQEKCAVWHFNRLDEVKIPLEDLLNILDAEV